MKMNKKIIEKAIYKKKLQWLEIILKTPTKNGTKKRCVIEMESVEKAKEFLSNFELDHIPLTII